MFSISHQLKALAAGNRFMKSEDIDLITHTGKYFGGADVAPTPNTAFFYPSAGCDLLTPLIIALPYCNQFYYYEHDLPRIECLSASKMHGILNHIRRLCGIKSEQKTWHEYGSNKVFEFKYFGVEKKLYWINEENTNFLKHNNLELTFYFHRGDSYGEGGSGQFWDSELMPTLISKTSKEKQCLFITDGEPGGLAEEVKNNAQTFKVHDILGGSYFYGMLPK